MAWWNSNNNQPAQPVNGALNLGLANGQQQVPQMGANYAQQGYQNPFNASITLKG